jgi:hypothetical protein
MHRRGGTGFLLAYVLLSAFYALADIARGAFTLIAMMSRGLFNFAGTGIDATKRGRFEAAIANAVAPYIPVLVTKRQKLLRADDYGVINEGPWSKELGYFLGNVLLPNLQGYEGYARRHLALTATLVDNIVSDHQPLPPG